MLHTKRNLFMHHQKDYQQNESHVRLNQEFFYHKNFIFETLSTCINTPKLQLLEIQHVPECTPIKNKDYSLAKASKLALEPSSLLFNGYLASIPRVRQLKQEVDHSTPSSAVRNKWSHTSTPIYTFMAWTAKAITFRYCCSTSWTHAG
jgi:hypothetical protein